MTASTVQELKSFDEVFHEYGTVVEVKDRHTYVIETSSGTYHARRAVSCLVEPVKGDEVLFAGPQSGDLYVLAILERESGEALEVSPHGDMVIKLSDGRFVIAAS